MRKKIVGLWNKIMRIKILYPVMVIGRKMIFSDALNSILDFLERHTNAEYLKNISIFFESNKERIEENKKIFADNKSKHVYENIIKYRCTLKRQYLKRVRDPLKMQYFCPEIINLKKKEFFIDCGSYIGDTIINLNKIYPHWAEGGEVTVLCLEPDKYNALKCKENIKKMKKSYPNFNGYVMKRGVWREKTALYFKEGEEYSNKLEEIKKEGYTEIPVISIDCAVKKYRIKTKDESKVTFIKMDIEGSEPEALIGAKETILKDRPVLAIAIYHTEEQMISIIEYCKNNFPNYKFYIRHYSPAWGETDLYAIPYEYNSKDNNKL